MMSSEGNVKHNLLRKENAKFWGGGGSKPDPIAFVLLALYFLLPFVIYGAHLAKGDSLVSGDGLTNLYGMAFMGESLKSFDFPFWCPYLSLGRPFAEDATYNGAYLPMMLCSLLPINLQLSAYFGFHYAIGGAAMYMYLKKIRCEPLVSALVSTIYIFTVHMGGARKEHVHLIITALYVPVVLYFLERYLQERKINWLLAGSFCMSLQLAGGHLQYVVYSYIFYFFYLLCGGIHRRFSIKKMLLHGLAWGGSFLGFAAVSILPMAQFLRLSSQSGGTNMVLDLFKGLSLHPGKLLMMIFPYLYGTNVLSGMAEAGNYTSGMDIELFIGAIAVALIIAGLTLFRRDHYVRFFSVASVVVLLYACMAQIPFLAKVLYKIPVINLFRVCSRTLFLFTFCCIVILAKSLNSFCSEEGFLSAVSKGNLVVAGIILAVIGLYPLFVLPGTMEKVGFAKCFLVPVGTFIGFLTILYLGKIKKLKINWKKHRSVVAITAACLTIGQMLPFYMFSFYRDFDELTEAPSEIVENIGTSKLWTSYATTQWYGSNEQMIHRIPSLNAYTNFNLIKLHELLDHSNSMRMNSSGMYVFNQQDLISGMRGDNELLSMLGVKYIMLPENVELEQVKQAARYETDEVLIDEPQGVQLTESIGYQFAVWPVELEQDGYYHISVTLRDGVGGTDFYVDFFADGFASAEQVSLFTTEKGEKTYEAILPSGDAYSVEGILFRLIVLTESTDVAVTETKLEKVTPIYNNYYGTAYVDENIRIFENYNSEELVFAPDKVRPISQQDVERLYTNTDEYDILHTAYITGGDVGYDFSESMTNVSNIELSNNRVSANVSSTNGGFVNMSQTYYPGWRAYIDGKRAELYEVNGIIMGIFVPAGNHLVVFKYVPETFFVGIAISVGTIAICIFNSILAKRNERKRRIK